MRLVKCEVCSFVRKERGTGLLRVVAEWNGRSEKKCDILLDSKSAASQAAAECRCLVANGIDEDLFYYSLFKDRFPGGVSAVLALPVSASGRCFGVLELVNKVGGLPFDETDVNAIRLVADIAAAAYGTAEKLLSSYEQMAALKQNASLHPSAS
ncbi:MAG: GAF domain-containing protein, partial [Treponemataceae bacterium]|nr:GAF domain-containing protein [Treponemataceae bacterium]